MRLTGLTRPVGAGQCSQKTRDTVPAKVLLGWVVVFKPLWSVSTNAAKFNPERYRWLVGKRRKG